MPRTSESEYEYDRRRMRQWFAGEARADGVDRRELLRLAGASAALGALPTVAQSVLPGAAAVAHAAAGIVKPLPPEWFTVRGTNAEARFDALGDTGYHTPAERFFVRNHTTTPLLDAATWTLTVWGDGLRGEPLVLGLDDLRELPAVTRSAVVECAGNGRSLFGTQQGRTGSGTAWTMGAIGAARWRGARLSDVLRAAGVRRTAVDVMPRGLDAAYTTPEGAELGHVRRPLPLGKALDDVILAYEMNGEPLPPDHGHPVRVVVPNWVGIASVKWVGDIEVSTTPLYSPWNTSFYRLWGDSYPPEGSAPLTRQTLKSVFELPWNATLDAGLRHRLTGRSWSGAGGVVRVETSTDGGERWRAARLLDPPRSAGWVRWHTDWRPTTPGPATLMSRATDTTGRTQPPTTPHNIQGYLFDAIVRHPVTVR